MTLVCQQFIVTVLRIVGYMSVSCYKVLWQWVLWYGFVSCQ